MIYASLCLTMIYSGWSCIYPGCCGGRGWRAVLSVEMAKEGPGDGSLTCIEVCSSAICPFGLFSCEIPNNLLASVLQTASNFFTERILASSSF